MNAKIQTPMSGVCAAIWAALIAISSQASARPPRPRVESGTIETLDRDAPILQLQRQGEAAPLKLVWNSRSRVKATRFVTAAELTKGARVTVWYRTTFFGKRFATKIVIERSAERPEQQRPHSSSTPRP